VKKRSKRGLHRRYGRATALQAYNLKTGKVVKPGSTVTDFRGDKVKFLYATRANETGRDGKVLVKDWGDFGHEYYARVYGLGVR
jgi:hypothetical protein